MGTALRQTLQPIITRVGFTSMFNTTTGGSNTAIGHRALYTAITSEENVVVGDSAGDNVTTSSYNAGYIPKKKYIYPY